MWQQIINQNVRPMRDITKEIEVHPPKWKEEVDAINKKYREFVLKQEIAKLKEDITEDTEQKDK